MKSITAATLTTLSLLSTCWIHPVLALRNVRQNIEDGVVQQQRQAREEEPVECFVTEMHGVSAPGMPHLPEKLTCVSINSESEIIYDMYGETDEFFYSERNIQGGHIKLTVPQYAIGSDGIKFSEATMDEIYMEVDEERRRKLISGIGSKTVLIIRVSNDNSSNGRVNESAWQLYTDIFTDENNAATTYRDCSKGRLTIQPAADNYANGIRNGVMEVTPPSDICSKSWVAAWNDLPISSSARNLADLIMIVLPSCVNFQGAAAWGETPGKATWYQGKEVAYPIVQVHELGHNFGHQHSGKGDVSYADGTCSMGNRGGWSDEGTKMCFNGAKTWFFGWFSDYHETVTLSSSSYSGTLIGASEMNWSDTIIVKILAEYRNTDTDLYVWFNRATGGNAYVTDNADQVVITEQSGMRQLSAWKAGLSAGQQWSTSWNYKTLVVKVCGISTSSGSPRKADIVIAYSGSSALNCPTIPSEDVYIPPTSNPDPAQAPVSSIPIKYDDTTLLGVSGIVNSMITTACIDISGWYDSDGFDCNWYGSGNSEVQCEHAYNHPNQGHSATTACCACGGGEEVEANETTFSKTIEEVIPVDNACFDESGWSDSGGKDCQWYEAYGSRCMNLGDRYANTFGKTANDACCYCIENR